MQSSGQEKSRIMGEMPMARLIPKLSVPIMISMLVQALYNVVDSIFVAKYDPAALTAVSFVTPLAMLMIAISTGMGVGINSLISRKLGEKDGKAARCAAWNGLFVEMCGFLISFVIGAFFAKGFMAVMTDDANVQSLGVTYLRIVCCLSFGCYISILMERTLQATGNTLLSMIIQLCGAITNIILDPIMIFGLLGFPRMGIAGAAIATVTGQIVSAVVGLIVNQKKNKELAFHFSDCKIRLNVLKPIVSVGVPSTIMQAISSVLNILLNMILAPFGAAAVSVMGVYFKLQSFVFMPIFGLGNGMVPILAYNYGARNKKRVYSGLKISLLYAVVIMVIGTLIFMIFPEVLLSLFEKGTSSELTEIGKVALRVISSCFCFAGVGITLSTLFQALGKGTYSLIMSLCRQIVVLLPAAYILSKTGGLNALWWAFPIAEIVSLILALFLYKRCKEKMIEPLAKGNL